MTLETKALPATAESADEVRKLRADGWRVTGRSHGTVRLARTAPDAPTSRAVPAAEAGNGSATAVPGPTDDDLRAEFVDAVGVRAADALAAAGLHSLAHARSALAAAPDAFAALPGVGPATVAKLQA